jgi:hypothetical protein
VHSFQTGLADEEDLAAVALSAAKVEWSKSPELAAWPIRTSLADD